MPEPENQPVAPTNQPGPKNPPDLGPQPPNDGHDRTPPHPPGDRSGEQDSEDRAEQGGQPEDQKG